MSDAAAQTPLVFQMLALGDEFVLPHGEGEHLGKSLRELLTQAIAASRAQGWERARVCCEAGKRVTELEPEYRGKINVKLAAGIVDFYLATAMVGQEEWENALATYQRAGNQLSFIAPIASAAAWLAIARVHGAQNDVFGSLWALQKSWNLIEDQSGAAADALRGLLEWEYNRAHAALEALPSRE